MAADIEPQAADIEADMAARRAADGHDRRQNL
jgi:hypothetical protein